MDTSLRAIPVGNAIHRLLAAAAVATVLSVPAAATMPFSGMTPIATAELRAMRGGFSTPAGVVVRFGFETAITVNDQLQQRIVVAPILVSPGVQSVEVSHTDSSGATTTQQISMDALSNGPLELSSVINGGLTSLRTVLGPNGHMTIVQNRMNNAAIQRATTFNVDIAGMRSRIQAARMNRMVTRGLATRSLLAR